MDTFDIKELILKGKRAVKEYTIPNIGKVFVRPLTDLELSKGDAALISEIKDAKTRAYLLGKSEDVEGVDFSAIAESSVRANIIIAYTAMKDFAKGEFTIELVEQLPGINGLAEFVKEISGVQKTIDEAAAAVTEIKDFRKE